jgi:hypothetical protein
MNSNSSLKSVPALRASRKLKANGSVLSTRLLPSSLSITRIIRSSALEKTRTSESWSSGVVWRLQIASLAPFLQHGNSRISLAGDTVREDPGTRQRSARLAFWKARSRACAGSDSPKLTMLSCNIPPQRAHLRPVR